MVSPAARAVERIRQCRKADGVVTDEKLESTRSRAGIWSWVKWPVAGTLLAWVLWQNREGLSRVAHATLHWPSLATAFAMCGGSITLTFVRWYWLVKAQGFAFRLRDGLRLGFVGYLFNFVGPGGVGGDLIKAALLAKEQPGRRTTAVATVLLDRVLGLLALFVIGACAAWPRWGDIRANNELVGVVWLLAGGAVAGVVGLTLMLIPAVTQHGIWKPFTRLPVVGRGIGELIEDVSLYQSKRGVVFGALGLSVIGHFGMIASFYFSAQAVGAGTFVPSFLSHLFFIPAAEFVGVIVPVPGGVGALEFAVARFYEHAGAANGTGLLTCLAYRAVTLTIAAIGAGYYLTSRREIAQAMHSSDAPAT